MSWQHPNLLLSPGDLQAMPLWPLVLAALPKGVDARYFAALLSLLALPLAFLLALRLAGPAVAILVLALMAFDLDQAVLAGSLLTEPLFTVLLLAFALAWTGGATLLAAIALGLAALTRPEAFLIPFAIALFAREWKRPLLLMAGVVLALCPWVVRNAVTFDTFLPFTTTGGITLNAGMNEVQARLPFRKRGQGRGKRFPHAVEMARNGTEIVLDRKYAGQAIAYARSHVPEALSITAAKAALLFTPLQRKGTSVIYALATLLCWWALLVRGVRFKVPLVGPLLAVMSLVGLVFLAIPRYHVPYHPYVFLLAAAAIAGRRRHSQAV